MLLLILNCRNYQPLSQQVLMELLSVQLHHFLKDWYTHLPFV